MFALRFGKINAIVQFLLKDKCYFTQHLGEELSIEYTCRNTLACRNTLQNGGQGVIVAVRIVEVLIDSRLDSIMYNMSTH